MKLAVLASSPGEKVVYLYEFFKEGNRIEIECLLTDDTESPLAQRMKEEGIEIVGLSPETDFKALAETLKGKDVELLVVDDFNSEIPEDLKLAFNHAVVAPTSKESAPLEVIETSRKLKARAEEVKEVSDIDKEWNQALGNPQNEPAPPHFQDTPPQYQTQNPQPGQAPHPHSGHPQFIQPGHPHHPYPGQPQYPQQGPVSRPYSQPEPMPDTYLVWSVIITILCCLIPGIIAIIYSASVSSKYYQGNIEGAKRASRNAQIWCIVSIICGIVWATLYVPLTLFLA